MKYIVMVIGFFLTSHTLVFGQYVPKDKRKPATDTLKTQPQASKQTQPQEPKREAEPLEKRFVAYAMAFPSFLQTTTNFSINGGTASFNLGYRLHEKFNAGITTNYGYTNYKNVNINGIGTVDGSIRSTGVGAFAKFNFYDYYFVWAEYSNIFTKTNDRLAQTTERSWYAQPLFGLGASYEFGKGDSGVAWMMLFNPKYGDIYSPYKQVLVQRILFYFNF